MHAERLTPPDIHLPGAAGSGIDAGALLHAMNEHAIIGITNARGEITYVNRKFCEVSKYSESELIGKNHRIINSGYHSPEFFQNLWGTIRRGEIWRGEIRNMAKDGTYYWVYTTIVPVLDASGVPQQYISLRTEITTVKHLQYRLEQSAAQLEATISARTAELRHSNHQLRTEMEERAQAQHRLEQDAIRTQLLYELTNLANRAASVEEGVSSFLDEILAHSDWDLGHAYELRDGLLHPTNIWSSRAPDSFPQLREITRDTPLRSGQGVIGRVFDRIGIEWVADLQCGSPNLTYIRCAAAKECGVRAVVAVPVVIRNEVTHVLEFYSAKPAPFDQGTARTLLQAGVQLGRTVERERSRKSDQLEHMRLLSDSKFKALGEMAAGIAHEINTPLAVLYMRAQQVRDLVASRDVPQPSHLEKAEQIVNTAQRISRIITGLRNFTTKDPQAAPAPAPVCEIIEETLTLCRQTLKKAGVDVVVERVPAELVVECRSHQISQVLLNLLNNARDAMEQAGSRWIRVSVLDRESELGIAVSDSGPAIPKDVEARLFDPFFTTKGGGKGTGIGLSISREIAQSHGGRLSYDRDHGYTRFVIWLPKKRAGNAPRDFEIT